jgi:hypothetical protein
MFLEPEIVRNLKAPEERNVFSIGAHGAPPELEIFSGDMVYKHWAALRPEQDLGSELSSMTPA